MSEWNTDRLIAADKKVVWHPFTNMGDWGAADHEPLVLVEGHGAILRDSRGREYIDGNSSIWTNIHGHNHPHIFAAIHVPDLKTLDRMSATEAAKIAGVVIEPLIQGAAGMKLWPPGTLPVVREWCDRTSALLIVDEVMTGFGRTGKMFASEHESVLADIVVLGKGLTGGYLPLAMTLVKEEIFSRFDGSIGEGKALAYGHSYTGNALGCAAAKASLEIFKKESVLEKLQPKIEQLNAGLAKLRGLAAVNEVRRCGFIAGIELKQTADVDPSTALRTSLATKVCLAARGRGLLTRPIRNVIVLMPPLCITSEQLTAAIGAIHDSILEVCGQ